MTDETGHGEGDRDIVSLARDIEDVQKELDRHMAFQPMRPNPSHTPTRHPAKYSPQIMGTLLEVIHDHEIRGVALDPFGGVGYIHEVCHPSKVEGLLAVAVEIEAEWAQESANRGTTFCADLLEWAPWARRQGWRFDAVVTSPAYGNRMADSHVAKDGSKRLTYTHQLGRQLTEGNSGGMQWGKAYRAFHVKAWRAVCRLLEPGGWFLLNVKNHIRGGQEVDVTGFHKEVLDTYCEHQFTIEVAVQGMGFGQHQHTHKIGHESVLVYRKPVEDGEQQA